MRAKIARGRHPPRPNHLTATFKHRPASAITVWNPTSQKHLLQFPGLAAAAWPIGISRPPVPQNQGIADQVGIKDVAISFSFARR